MQQHNHKANFGRYVAECPRCVELHPDGKPARKPKAAKMTYEEFLAIQQTQQTQAAPIPAPVNSTDELVKIMLAEQAEKIREKQLEKVRKEQSRADLRRVVSEKMAQERANQEACSHTNDAGRTTINKGQIYNDGSMRPFCQRCMKFWPPVRPTKEEQPTAVEV